MIEIIFTSLLSSALGSAAIAFIFKTWFAARIKADIDLEYKKRFDIFSRELDRKEKIELVTELLAEYMKTPIHEPMPREQRILLNKLSFKACLWLPSDLVTELSKRLQNKSDAKTPYELVLMARSALLGDSPLTVENVTIWDLQLEKK